MKDGKYIPNVKARRILFLVAIVAALTPLSFLTDSETNAQTSSSAVADPPALKVVSASATAVELSWNAVTLAVSYDLRTWWAGADGWQRIDDGSLTGTSQSHQGVTEGRKYFYIVAGVDDNGRRGPWSPQVEVTIPASDTPTSTPTSTPMLSSTSTQTPTPTVSVAATPTSAPVALFAPTLQAEIGAGQITLRWGAVTNADSYRLIVWYNSIPDWQTIGAVLRGTSYIHRGLSAGTTYHYHVRAVAAGDSVSVWSERVSAIPSASVSLTQTPTPTAAAAALSTPALSAAGSDGAITLTWGAVANADSYQLIFWDREISDWRGIGGVLRGTSYTHGGLTAGTTHFYHVRAVAASGAVSAWSVQVSVVVPQSGIHTPTPTITAMPTVTPTPTITPTAATTERGALIALYEATDGANWNRNDNWATGAPLSTWYGVFTDRSGRVTRLDLELNGLTGTVPDLRALRELYELNLRINYLTGPIPDLSAFRKMRFLYLEYNKLNGAIPDLSSLTNLKRLYLNGNKLTGPVPSLNALYNLEELDLSGNELTGEIPDLGSLYNVIHLSLSSNRLSGKIPDLSALNSLRRLFLYGNELTGEIPNLSALYYLGDLSLSDNRLTGVIPDLGTLTNLKNLNLSGNELTGHIPDLSGLTHLTYLHLGENGLTGQVPDLSALTNLRNLSLPANKLVGAVPDISALTALHAVDLSENKLTGFVPNLRDLTDLVRLYLQDNELTGPVPQLSTLTKLSKLDLSGNRLCLPAGESLSHQDSDVAAHLTSLNLATCTDAELLGVPGLPLNVTATVGVGEVTLTWEAAVSAVSYELRVWDSIHRKWGLVEIAQSSTTYTHPVSTDGRNYYYQVRGRGENDVRGPWSERVRAIVVPQRFPPPPLSLELDLFYQKYLEVEGVVVVAPSEVSDEKMVQAREIVSEMFSGSPDFSENASANYLRIAIFKKNAKGEEAIQIPEFSTAEFDLGGTAIPSSGGWLAIVPEADRDCYIFIHEFAHAIQFTIEDQPGGQEFTSMLEGLYQAALNAGLWHGAYASTNIFEYWAETVTYWFQESVEEPEERRGTKLEDYDPEIATLIAEIFGDADVPSYCKP